MILGFLGYYKIWFNGHAGIGTEPGYWLLRLGLAALAEGIIFWIGIVMVYLTSEQLGIKWRVLGIVFGWIPIAHLVMLRIIIKMVDAVNDLNFTYFL